MSKMKASRMIRLTLVSTSVAAALMLAGCSVIAPEKLSSDDLMRLANVDQQLMFAAQEPVTAPITMEEAVARALKYNLEHRLAMMERAVQENIADVQSMSLLPKLTASAGYRDRSNELASSSESLATGKESLVPSKSSERDGRTADLELSWNVLDFGLSYFEAQASTNKSYASEERRRRVVADIARQTRAAWLSAVSAERLRDEVADALDDASKALAQSKEAGGRGLVKPLDALRYQRDLLNMVRQLETLEDELVKSKAKLATLMNLQPGTPFQLAVPSTDAEAVPAVPYKLSDLEVLAMVRRPEIREESYLARNAVLETRMSLLKLFPNVQLFAGLNYDSNKYLANNDWADVGTQVSWNLMSLFTAPKILKGGELREELAPLRRQAIRMTVLSQVHVAWHQRFAAEKAFRRADELSGACLCRCVERYAAWPQRLVGRRHREGSLRKAFGLEPQALGALCSRCGSGRSDADTHSAVCACARRSNGQKSVCCSCAALGRSRRNRREAQCAGQGGGSACAHGLARPARSIGGCKADAFCCRGRIPTGAAAGLF